MNSLNDTVGNAIVKALQRSGPCCLDTLVMQLPNHDWNEIFATVDRMSRDGRLALRRIRGSEYQLSLPGRSDGEEEVYG
jgi:hypothetical protein